MRTGRDFPSGVDSMPWRHCLRGGVCAADWLLYTRAEVRQFSLLWNSLLFLALPIPIKINTVSIYINYFYNHSSLGLCIKSLPTKLRKTFSGVLAWQWHNDALDQHFHYDCCITIYCDSAWDKDIPLSCVSVFGQFSHVSHLTVLLIFLNLSSRYFVNFPESVISVFC